MCLLHQHLVTKLKLGMDATKFQVVGLTMFHRRIGVVFVWGFVFLSKTGVTALIRGFFLARLTGAPKVITGGLKGPSSVVRVRHAVITLRVWAIRVKQLR